MIRILVVILGVLAFSQGHHAQSRCDFDVRLRQSDQERLQAIRESIHHAIGQISPRTPVTVPVVFHIVYHTPEENISDLQIRSQIEILNRDFAFASENIRGIPDEFSAVGTDTEIRFCLATVDPGGQPTSGITRTETTRKDIGTHRQPNGRYSVHYDEYGGKSGWDPERYINIWVAPMEGILGSAAFPGMAQFPEEDGVVIDPRFVGAIGLATRSAPFDRGHTLAHELGHYFGLYHIWGMGQGNCTSDDFIEDTPLQEHAYLGCPVHPQVSCGSPDMFMNFMDFTTDRCLAFFTRGQAAWMQAALFEQRATLIENTDACAIPDSGKDNLDEAIIVSSGEHQIVVILPQDAGASRRVYLYSMDGRLVRSGRWDHGSIFWFDTEGLAPGVYVVRLESGDEDLTRRVVLYE